MITQLGLLLEGETLPYFKRYIFLLLISGFLLGGCSKAPFPNVILITIDTLRPDHLSSYGYSRLTSPNIDQIASEGIIFENAIAQSSWTLPSVASILTSRFPSELGMVHSFSKFRKNSLRIATILKENGFQTAAFVSSGHISAKRGFDEGFEVFEDSGNERAMSINERVFKWLSQRSKKKEAKPFFLWVHYFDVHSDYDAPPPFDKVFDKTFSNQEIGRTDYLLNIIKNGLNLSPAEVSNIQLLYDREINYADHHIGNLLESLRNQQVLENSILIIGADHGDEFMEHGKLLHALTLYDELIRVPLIIRYPKKLSKGTRISEVVQNLDIVPTVLDLLAIDTSGFQCKGRSLLPLIEGTEEVEPFSFSETQPQANLVKDTEGWPEELFKRLYMIRTSKKKLIHDQKNQSWEMFDLVKDPGEKLNMYSENIMPDNDLKSALVTWEKSLENNFSKYEEIEKGGDEIKKLRALGYLN